MKLKKERQGQRLRQLSRNKVRRRDRKRKILKTKKLGRLSQKSNSG
jgi:hypothetical protein